MQDPRTIPELQMAFSRKVRGRVLNLDRFLLQYNSFNVLRLEDVFAKTDGEVPPFRQSNFLMLFVKNGKGNRSMGHHRFTIENNSLAIIPRHMIHTAHYTTQPG